MLNDQDDKTLVILCVTLLSVVAMFVDGPNALELVEKMAYGMFGMAVGKSLK